MHHRDTGDINTQLLNKYRLLYRICLSDTVTMLFGRRAFSGILMIYLLLATDGFVPKNII